MSCLVSYSIGPCVASICSCSLLVFVLRATVRYRPPFDHENVAFVVANTLMSLSTAAVMSSITPSSRTVKWLMLTIIIDSTFWRHRLTIPLP